MLIKLKTKLEIPGRRLCILEDDQIQEVANSKVRQLLIDLSNNGFFIKSHPKNVEKINVYSHKKMKNVVGDLRVSSVKGSFRLEDNNSKWKSFRKFGFVIDDETFVDSILKYIEEK